MKILVPTDFSKSATVAVHYAANLAKHLSADLVLLNVVFINAPPTAMVGFKTKQIEEKIEDNAKQDLILLINELKKEPNAVKNISFKTIVGYPIEDVVDAYAMRNQVDLIIMGTKGASGLTKVLIGSNAAATINKSTIPVITVPVHVRFNGIKQIVHASDLYDTEEEMKILIPLAQLFGAAISIFYVSPISSKRKIDIENIKKDIENKYNFNKLSISISVGDDITDGIDEHVADLKADMLTMFTHELTFFEKLFGKSVTREMAFHTWIPLLSIKK